MGIIKQPPGEKASTPPAPPAGPKKSGLLKPHEVIRIEDTAPPAPPTAPDGDSGKLPPPPPAAPPGSSKEPSNAPGASKEPSVAPAPQAPPVDRAIIEKAHEEAAQLIQQAMQQRDELLKRAKQAIEAEMEATNNRCQEAFMKAQEDGFERGKAEGAKAGMEEFRGLMNEAKSMMTQLLNAREEIFKSATGEIARLALRVAEKVIGHAANVDEEIVLHTIKQALERVKARETITVRVNPVDVEFVRMNKDQFERMVEGLKSFDVTGDPKVDRGGCIIETNLGNVDARIQTQMMVITQAFAEVERTQNAEGPAEQAES
ncbi:MAG: FliH/SctL family protein [Candidatus Xenobia bacterium]